MLNPFPIQFLALAAYFILRVTIGLVLLKLGFSHLRHRHTLALQCTHRFWPFGYTSALILAATEIITAGFIIAGAFTQYALIVVAILCIKMLIFHSRFNHPSIPPRIFYFLLLGSSVTIFITGAGIFAFDLPI